KELALRWFANSAPLMWVLAQRAFQARDFHEAARSLERLVGLGRAGAYDRSAAFDPGILGEAAPLNLGTCYVRLGDLRRAERCFVEVLNSPTHQAQAQQALAAVQQLRQQSPRGT